MSVFEERGVFWWHDEAIAEGLLAPDAHVAGLLRVEENGRAVLEPDGYLPNPLHEAGIDGQILKRWAFDSFLAAPIKMHLVQAGLLDKRVLGVEKHPDAQVSEENASGDIASPDDLAQPK